MPVFYTNVIEEHIATRTKAGLFDICHMGEFLIEGKDAAAFLQKVITNDIGKLPVGKAFYSVMCHEDGGIVDDIFIYKVKDVKFMMVVNASNIDKDFKWLMQHKSFLDEVTIINISDTTAKLDLQGPSAERILQSLTDFQLAELKRFHFFEGRVDGVSALVSRTGYTGEDGFEIYFNYAKAVQLWNKILAVGKEYGLKPIGLGARDTLRVEACYSLYGHELTDQINPLEAGLGFIVKLNKSEFIGKKTLQATNPSKTIVAFDMSERGIPREHYKALKNDQDIGVVTSGTMSPTFKKGIGMAFIQSDQAAEGNEIHINIREKLYKAKIVKRPIYAYHGK